ncbi:MAG: COX15/CtaA family protein [Bdellovibrionota bacterium]
MQPLVTVRRLRLASAVIAALSLVLIGMGGYVRGTGAGLACPDWPLCYGRAVPEQLHPGVFQEVAHRYVASIVSTLAIAYAVLCFANRRRYPRLWHVAKLFLLVLASQVVLGGLTVLLKLNPFIVTSHLALGTAFFQLLGLTALSRLPKNRQEDSEMQELLRPRPGKPNRLSTCTLILCAAVYFQMLLGGFIGASGAALACPDIPFCNGRLIPESGSLQQGIQMLHRGVATVILILTLVMTLFSRPLSGDRLKKRGHLFGVVFMVALQIALGLSNVYFAIPVSGAIAHLILAQLILLGLLRFYFRLNPQLGFFFSEESRRGSDAELGEYTPTKRNFAANVGIL